MQKKDLGYGGFWVLLIYIYTQMYIGYGFLLPISQCARGSSKLCVCVCVCFGEGVGGEGL
jgi:hypothetical protein